MKDFEQEHIALLFALDLLDTMVKEGYVTGGTTLLKKGEHALKYLKAEGFNPPHEDILFCMGIILKEDNIDEDTLEKMLLIGQHILDQGATQ